MEIQEQLNQMQAMMEQLVKMVGHNNSVTEELVQRMDRLEVRIGSLEAHVGSLETRMKNGFSDVVQMITVLGQKVDKIDSTQVLHSDMLRRLAADTAQHEAEIILLKRAK
ncbi:hypothetical protein [Sporomusa malonica]|uniref:Uncharacterized protein n=1 Tax=Sporomusa malonica TaxID=112901 RepID=A0A1W1YSL4_9FIRM|nr:hypothetical protein [Sporomusa malonica]SMC39139.1 hypothetical protein SAMN04488500_102153 [Sporomusa malonica]